jgi:hypothetical protein
VRSHTPFLKFSVHLLIGNLCVMASVTGNYQGETALHKAVLRGSQSAVALLIKVRRFIVDLL